MESRDHSDGEESGSAPGHPDRLLLIPTIADGDAATLLGRQRRSMVRPSGEPLPYEADVRRVRPVRRRRLVPLQRRPSVSPQHRYITAGGRAIPTAEGPLVGHHLQTDYQRIEQLMKMDALGTRKPSELLAHMLEICPSGEEKSKFFAFLFCTGYLKS